jgi:hypothetical protein
MRALLLFALGCGTGNGGRDSGLPPPECPTHDGATFELGTGDTAFEPLVEDQDLAITPGPQGGCHFWLAVRTAGFAQRRFKIQYEVFFADSSTTTMSRSTFTVRLRQVPEMPDLCEQVGVTAFLIEPWRFEDRSVRIDVNVTDDEGRTDSESRTVVARWPSSLPDNGCGER